MAADWPDAGGSSEDGAGGPPGACDGSACGGEAAGQMWIISALDGCGGKLEE